VNILHIVPSYKPAFVYGGPIISVSRLCESQAGSGHQVTVYTTTANGKTELVVVTGRPTSTDGVSVWYFPRITKDHTHASPALWGHLWRTLKQYDAVHIHSWWNFLVLGSVLVCWLKGVRPVLSIRGMLSGYSFSYQSSTAKKILHFFLGKSLLKWTFLHATTQNEWEECQRVIPGWQGFLAPNILALPNRAYTKTDNALFTIGVLSRLDPVKNVDTLISALGTVCFPFQLLIAGSGEASYVEALKLKAKQAGIEGSLQWLGWQAGDAKYQFLASLDLMVLISHTENFANVVIESLAVGTPVLVSKGVGLSNTVMEQHWGWVSASGQAAVRETLETAWQNKAARLRIAQAAPAQIIQLFDAKTLADDYVKAYASFTSPLK
jgi:glycosyltransferase involved in cell wall biosynthesis